MDLTGRPVSNTSRTYPDSRFGWMDDEVRLGYQAALLSLSGQAVSRLWVVGQHLPGNARPGECLRGLIRAAEAKLKVRPRRRVELVAWREAEVTQAEMAAYRASAGLPGARLDRAGASRCLASGIGPSRVGAG